MSEDIDNSNLVYSVHWNIPLNEAERQFYRWGFNGIRDFTKESVLNGNDARTDVIASAKKQNAKYYFVGNYDWGTTADSAIYRFRYTSYTGALIDGTGDAEYSAAWSGKE